MSKCFNATTKTFRDYTSEEQADYDARMKALNDSIVPRKLEAIRKLRNEKLSETDYLAFADNTLSDEMKTFRKSMRDIPQNYSQDKYDELLARDSSGKLTHTVWSKP
mgnify:CR=1 FL=1|tara:strand:+ start:91 stop:411 length:321 start_codon:yes stop_codon:yes gene_type:complete